MSDRRLKIGLDYHGVIDQRPAYFAGFCSLARAHGHSIYIISGGPIPLLKEYLRKNNIEYDFVFAVSDYYQALGDVRQDKNGNLFVPESLWNKAKAEFCRRAQIDFHIDDSQSYLKWFSTPFCLYDKKDNCCLFGKTKISFALPAKNVLSEIEALVFEQKKSGK